MSNWVRQHGWSIVISVVIGIALVTGPPFWFHYLKHNASASPANTNTSPGTSSAGVTGVIGFSGGCAPFQIYAQNRWAPWGVAVRTEPNVVSKQVATYPGNYSLAVNGWVHSSVAYPTNVAPFNNDVWYHLADGQGWVSFADVRADHTAQDPTGLADGRPPAPLSPSCQGAAQ